MYFMNYVKVFYAFVSDLCPNHILVFALNQITMKVCFARISRHLNYVAHKRRENLITV